MTTVSPIDWPKLRTVARDAAAHAYAPYSKLSVGAAGLVDSGHVVSGCNVENASYGLTLCAECGLVCDLCRAGGGRLLAVSIVDGSGEQLWPCGRCRQLLLEHGGLKLQVDGAHGPCLLEELLPHPFLPEDLPTPQ